MKKHIITAFMLIMAMAVHAGGAREPQTGGANSGTADAQTRTQTETPSSGSIGDGALTWTLATQSEIGYMGSIAYGNGRFIAMMRTEGYERWPVPPTQKMLYSMDGIAWTVKDTTLRGTNILTFSNGRFFATSGDLRSSMATSTDGENWTVVVNTQGAISGPVYGNGKWVLVTRYRSNASSSGFIMYSTDGLTWTNVANRPSRFDFNAVAYGDGKFIAMDEDGRLVYSTDGVTWTVAPGTHGNGVHTIAYGNGRFVKIGWDHSSYSEDGLSWEYIDFFGFPGQIASKIVYGGGKFVAIDYNGRVASSVDGITWIADEINLFRSVGGGGIRTLTYGAGRFVRGDNMDDGTGKSPTEAGKIAYSNLQE